MKSSKGKSSKRPAFPSSTPGSGFGSSGFGVFGSSSSQSSLSYLAEPPTFSNISDPNVVVSFKNVLKKDSTTKGKALEELLSYVQAHPHKKDGGVEEAILDVWVQLYPRTSIDNSRRVRELSHNLQFELMKSARKRMERHVPTIVGAWLAGLYDRDRVVARAANDGLASFLNTPEKVLGFWKKCQGQILDFAIEGIQETQDTLSDERSTTKEDSEAKYFRVVTASLSLVLGLLQKVGDEDIAKAQARYDDFFAEYDVWKGITYSDPSVRKTVCQLVFVCLDRKLPCAQETKVRQAIVTGGLKTNQAGSALEYVRALTKLSQASPDIWTAGEKKSSLSRLQSFISKGSQGSPPKFWEHLDQLLSLVPADILTPEHASSLLTSLKSGVTNREEPRTNTSFAWKCYIDTARRLLKSLSADDQLILGKEQLFPLFEQFLFSVSERSTSIPVGVNAMTVFVEAYIALAIAETSLSSAFSEEWERLASIFSANISGSLPEVSKEFQISQDKIGEEGRRWFALVGQIHEKVSKLEGAVPDYTTAPSRKVISQSVSLLESRNLKPFGAAQILEFALSTSPHLFEGNGWDPIASFLNAAVDDGMSAAIESPSARFLSSCVRLLGSFTGKDEQYSQLWTNWATKTLRLAEKPRRDSTLSSLISHQKGAELAKNDTGFQAAIIEQALSSAKGQSNSWDLLDSAVTYQALSDESYHALAKALISLFDESPQSNVGTLKALETLVKGQPQLFSANEELHTALVAQLLSLSELSDSAVSGKSRSIRTLLDSHAEGKLPVVGIIQSNLDRAGPQSLEIETVASQAENATGMPLEELFPSTNVWMAQLGSFLQRPIHPALSITSNIGGAAALVASEETSHLPQVPRDRKGRSVPVRMALYLNRILEGKLDVSSLPEQFQVELLCLLCVTSQLVSDQITTMDDNGPWRTLHQNESVSEAEDLVSFAQGYLNTLVTNPQSPVPLLLLDLLVQQSKYPTASGFYSARALCELISSIVEAQGLSPQLEETLLKTEILKANPETALAAAAAIVGIGGAGQSSKAIQNFVNRLVSDAAGASPNTNKTHTILVLLTLCGQIYEKGELPVANNRIVFAVRQITSWLDEPTFSPAFGAEVCRALTVLLPCMKDVYGSYWEKTLEFCISLWEKVALLDLADALPTIHTSLKLVRTLETLSEPNDDLEDTLKETSNARARSLFELLKLDRDYPSQPLQIVDAMICREIEKLPMRQYPDLGDIFPLVATQSRAVQTAAFNLLHKAIPAAQEQKSVDVLLDKTDARLPDELLSLLLDAPTLEAYSDEALAQFPSSIRCYLLAWKLVFDAYTTSSFKVRNDFTEHLKSDDCLPPLLEFMFDVLGHSASHALKLDKAHLGPEQIREYDVKLAAAETEEKSMQWLLVHLFYLTLKYIPGLFRNWYIDCRAKQTRIAVEAWTTKFFSPLIIDDTLDDVQKWADTQEAPVADEQDLNIKVSRPAREVTAGYEVDEDEAAIAIKIPASYPIESVAVTGLRRVAVTERKWQSWIMTTQGVITFSNGNIIDGLQVFKRNIVGALKGQGECAICYSIISSDKRMPDKRCTTCKNLFHRTCLYKWFQSSNQNTCPLCRNPIDYLGADTQKRRQ